MQAQLKGTKEWIGATRVRLTRTGADWGVTHNNQNR